jgi:hypothetical protein
MIQNLDSYFEHEYKVNRNEGVGFAKFRTHVNIPLASQTYFAL